MNSLDPAKRYLPSSRQYGLIMEENRQKRAQSLAAARAKAREKHGGS